MRGMIALFVVGIASLLIWNALAREASRPAESTVAGPPQIGHMVFFKLKDSTAANRLKLVAACDKYLGKHEGVVFYATGVIGESFNEPVNDRNWDVGLHLVFADKSAHDKYQVHPNHLKFIDENKGSWESVRVFDSEIAAKGAE